MSRRGSKEEAQRRHAMRRASERYNLDLTPALYEALCKKIQTGQGRCLGRQSNRLTVWQIDTPATSPLDEGKVVKCNVVYDTQRHTIVTFLPEGVTNAKGVPLIGEEAEADSL